MASRNSSGSSTFASWSRLSSTSSWPSACSACMSRLRCILLGRSRSSAPSPPGRVSASSWASIIVVYDTQHDRSASPPVARRPRGRTSDPMTIFSISDDRLADLAQDALKHARSLGASDASCEASESTGLSVTVRHRKVETIERTRDKGLAVTVYIGRRRGHASTSDFSKAAIRQAVEAAYNIARFTAEDDAAGLPEPDTLQRAPPELDLFHPWLLDTEEAIRLAQRCEKAAFAVSPQIVNSEGANVYTSSGHFVLANTRDFVGGYPYSRHSISASPIARDERGMQRDDWYSSSRI